MQKAINNCQKRLFWDLVKGIGIVSIVVGHCCGFSIDVIKFVYLYHLPIFFFVSGFLYSEQKYGDAPHLNVANRIRTSWPKYSFYMLFYILMHNVFLKLGIIINSTEYDISNIVVAIISTITFSASETLGGALWFAPVLIVSSSLFGCIIFAGRRAHCLTGKKWIKYTVILLLTAIAGLLGVFSNMFGMYFTWHIQTSLVVLPLLTIAWLVANHTKNLDKWIHWIPGGLACGIMIYGIRNWNWHIELAANIIVSPGEFYLISLLGIYFCLFLAKYILYLPGIKKIVSFFGKYSFDIMAGHFLAFKLVDFIYASIVHESDKQIYGVFPVAYSARLWPIYIIAGLILPSVIAYIWSKTKTFFQEKLSGTLDILQKEST